MAKPARDRFVGVDLDPAADKALSGLALVADGLDAVLANSVNRTSTWAKKEAEDRIRRHVAFPAGYLTKNGRLGFSRASYLKPTASIMARFKPNLLTTFAKNVPAAIKQRATPAVEVRPGVVSFMEKAFYVRLKTGQMAIAMREKDYRDRYGAPRRKPFGGIVLLHAPSIDQNFFIQATDIGDDVLTRLRAEVLAELQRKGI